MGRRNLGGDRQDIGNGGLHHLRGSADVRALDDRGQALHRDVTVGRVTVENLLQQDQAAVLLAFEQPPRGARWARHRQVHVRQVRQVDRCVGLRAPGAFVRDRWAVDRHPIDVLVRGHSVAVPLSVAAVVALLQDRTGG